MIYVFRSCKKMNFTLRLTILVGTVHSSGGVSNHQSRKWPQDNVGNGVDGNGFGTENNDIKKCKQKKGARR